MGYRFKNTLTNNTMFGFGNKNERAAQQKTSEMNHHAFFDQGPSATLEGASDINEATGNLITNEDDWQAPEVGDRPDSNDDYTRGLLERYQNPETADDMLSEEEESHLRKLNLI